MHVKIVIIITTTLDVLCKIFLQNILYGGIRNGIFYKGDFIISYHRQGEYDLSFCITFVIFFDKTLLKNGIIIYFILLFT